MTARIAYATLAAALLAAAIVVGPWQLVVAGAVAPDLALLLGAGAPAPGQLHPRAVPYYNAVHRFWGPALLAPLVPALGLAWGFHVALDRAVGYGLRDAHGFQR